MSKPKTVGDVIKAQYRRDVGCDGNIIAAEAEALAKDATAIYVAAEREDWRVVARLTALCNARHREIAKRLATLDTDLIRATQP